MRRAMQMPEKTGADGVGYGVDYQIFWIDRFHPHSTRQHTAFVAKSRVEVDAFHAAAMGAGGTDDGDPAAREGQSTPIALLARLLIPAAPHWMDAGAGVAAAVALTLLFYAYQRVRFSEIDVHSRERKGSSPSLMEKNHGK